MIFKFSYKNYYDNEDISSRNYEYIQGYIKEHMHKDWEKISKNLVEDYYLFQSDADKLMNVWKELLQTNEEDKQEAIRISMAPKKMRSLLWGLCERIWKNVINKTVGEYFQHLIFGCVSFVIVYIMFLNDMTNEMYRYFFGIAAAIWSSFAFGHKKDKEEKLWGVGITCFVLLVGAYWVMKVLAKLL